LSAVGQRQVPTGTAAEDGEAGPASPVQGLELTSREWTEVTAASDRCASYLFALHLNLIAGLDAAKLAENPARAAAKDSRRPASD
ncbi:hypothetical protein, partial [Psychroserpens mesophilus]